MKLHRLITLVLLIGLIACSHPIVLHYPATPHFYGRVIDRDTKQPIEGAMVFLKDNPAIWAKTTPEGYFDLAGVERAYNQPMLGDLYLPTPSARLIIEAPGYRPMETGMLEGQTVSVLQIDMGKL